MEPPAQEHERKESMDINGDIVTEPTPKLEKSASVNEDSESESSGSSSESEEEEVESESESESEDDAKSDKKKKKKKKKNQPKAIVVSEQFKKTGFNMKVSQVDTTVRGLMKFASEQQIITELKALEADKKPVTKENLSPYAWYRITEAQEEWKSFEEEIQEILHPDPEKAQRRKEAPKVNRRPKKPKAEKTEKKNAKEKKVLTEEEKKKKLDDQVEFIANVNKMNDYDAYIAKLKRVRMRLNKNVLKLLTIWLDKLLHGITRNAYVNAQDAGRKKIMPEHGLQNAVNNVDLFPTISGLQSVRRYMAIIERNQRTAASNAELKKNKSKDDKKAKKELLEYEFDFESTMGLPPLKELIKKAEKKNKKPKEPKEPKEQKEKPKKPADDSDSSSDSDSDEETQKKKKKKKTRHSRSKKAKKAATVTLSFVTHMTHLCNCVKSQLVAQATKPEIATSYSYINISNDYRMMARNIILEVLWRFVLMVLEEAKCGQYRTISLKQATATLRGLMVWGGVSLKNIDLYISSIGVHMEQLSAFNAEKNRIKQLRKAEKEKENDGKDKKKKKEADSEPEEPKKEKESKKEPKKESKKESTKKESSKKKKKHESDDDDE